MRPRPFRPGTVAAFPAYLTAALLGVLLAAWCFPAAIVAGRAPTGWPDNFADPMQHMIGQLYFLREPLRVIWHDLPVLRAVGAGPPPGARLAFTDSAPLEAFLLRLLHPVWPVQQGITLLQAISWALQPVAAVFALRGTGERRWFASVAVAVLAVSLPTWLIRLWHAALDCHFLLLIAIGLYLRAVAAVSRRRRRVALLLSGLLCAASLLIHPYLMALCLAVLFAVPLTLVCRGDLFVREAIAGALLATLLVAGIAAMAGYLAPGSGAGGYTLYSMNLLSPFWPQHSALLPFVPGGVVDATGGQAYEGMQYLGAGLLVSLGVAGASRNGRRALAAMGRGHPGLVVMAIGATLFALSNRAYGGHLALWRVTAWFPLTEQFRSGGRMFWLPAYLLLVAAPVAMLRGSPRAAPFLLVVVAVLQFADASTLRNDDRVRARAEAGAMPAPWGQFDRILARHARLMLRPRLQCHYWTAPDPMPPLFLAARRDLPADTVSAARYDPDGSCGLAAQDWVLPPGALGVVAGAARRTLPLLWTGSGSECRAMGDYVLCSGVPHALDGLPVASDATVPLDRDLSPGLHGPAGPLLLDGWGVPEPWGRWTYGLRARLVLPSAPPGHTLRLVVRLHPLDAPEQLPLPVDVIVDRRVIAHWSVVAGDANYEAVLPPRPIGTPPVLSFVLGHVIRQPGDRRGFGLGVEYVHFTVSGNGG